jgi:hypothetical protein
MTKHKSRRSNFVKTISNTTKNTLPFINKGLKNVGNVAKSSIPVIEKGVSVVYGTMSSGLDLGTKGIKSISNNILKRQHSRKSSRKSFRKKHNYSGGKKTRHYKR